MLIRSKITNFCCTVTKRRDAQAFIANDVAYFSALERIIQRERGRFTVTNLTSFILALLTRVGSGFCYWSQISFNDFCTPWNLLLVVTGDFAGHRLDGYRFVAKACETHFSDRHKQWRSYIKRANHPTEILQDAHQTIAWEAEHFCIDIALAWVFVWNFINQSIRIWSLPCHACHRRHRSFQTSAYLSGRTADRNSCELQGHSEL